MVRELTRRMKDSGIEWIGEIPEDWEVRKLGNISNLYTGNSIKDSEKDNYNSSKNSIPYIATKDVGFDNRIDYENGMYVKKEDIKFKRAYKDNTLICIEGGSAGRKIAKVEYEEVCFGNKLCCINSNIILNKYLYYYSLSPNFSNGFQSRITGLIPGVTLLEMRQIEVIIPPKTQQKSIADFLDKKTGEIDKIISKTKEAIEEYKKYKQSLITETVTKGLDKNAPMKDSGIEWIGEIPEHWEVSKVKYELECLNYFREPISADNRVNKLSLYDYYGASGVIDKIDEYNVNDTVLLIGEDGANLVMRNLPLVYKASGKFWVNNHAHILKPYKYNDYNYMAYLLEAGDYFLYITGSAQPKLTQANLMSLKLLESY